MIVLGIGAGIAFRWSAPAVASVSGGRFATATGLNSIARQLGAVLGVSILVAIIGTPSPAEVADAFDRGWTFAAGCFIVGGGRPAGGPGGWSGAKAEADQGLDSTRESAPGVGPHRQHQRRPCCRPQAPNGGAPAARPRAPQEVLRSVADLRRARRAKSRRACVARPPPSGGDRGRGHPVSSGRPGRLSICGGLGPAGGAAREGRAGEGATCAGAGKRWSVISPCWRGHGALGDDPRAPRDTELLAAEAARLRATDGGGEAHVSPLSSSGQMGLQLQRSRELEAPAATPGRPR